ncbi:hypothetical protein HYN59_05115 [Flavobacterium album]|uniref:Uncharacterized protein n=1 Tax=Flavobacterium album TaxID=2175091 RepID=A0A2S1QVX1_9FLAO|nr:hypothetical protein [Flavobacterium album]AWH84534.1 hypothetical protein HYN59_05115 [Flavobacterium album]
MNSLSDIINLMNEEDKQSFKGYLQSRNKRNDVQNIKLFRSIETDDINIQEKFVKTKKNSDAYHALRKRLYDTLVDFMANRAFEKGTSEPHEVLRLIVVSRLFFEHKLYKAAYKCLAKAEAKALKLDHFSLLNEIYQLQAQYAHFNSGLPLEDVIEKYNTNRKKMAQEEKLNMGYALLRRELAEIYHKGKVVNFRTLVKDTMAAQGISLDDILSFKSLYQILFIANEYASMNSDFSLVEPFTEKSYAFIAAKEDKAEGQLYYHIYILYLLANMHFRNRRFTDSKAYLDTMYAQMQKQSGKYHSRFVLRYSLLVALNDNYSGSWQPALERVEKALKALTAKSDPVDVNDLRMCAVIICLQQNDKAAFKHLKLFAHSDAWYEKKMGMDWAIKKSLVEILAHAQFENTELALSRLKSFKRRYKKYLSDVKEERVMDYALIVERYLLKPEIAKHPDFTKGILSLKAEGAQEDIFVLSFMAWLLAKASKRPVYDVILEMVKG